MINNVVLMGRICHTPELKNTQSGVEVLSFTVAVERKFTKKGEEKVTDFIDCQAWRQTAVFISTYFDKGSMIAVTGSLQTRSYEDKNGNKRKAFEVVVDNASFCGSKSESSNPSAPAAVKASNPDVDFDEIEEDDDLPFFLK